MVTICLFRRFKLRLHRDTKLFHPEVEISSDEKKDFHLGNFFEGQLEGGYSVLLFVVNKVINQISQLSPTYKSLFLKKVFLEILYGYVIFALPICSNFFDLGDLRFPV